MPVHDELGKRMKKFYEEIPKTKLMRRVPVALRIDGKSFHTFTKSFQKPFDEILIRSMQDTMKYLCKNIQGCVLGYTQSDEITLILIDYQRLNSEAWFDYEVQKMCSIAASMATMAFNKAFLDNTELAYQDEFYSLGLNDLNNFTSEEAHQKVEDDLETKYDIYYNKAGKAMFDARCFNIPKEEVTNLIYWRQLDAIRNSIQMVGQANFSHKELQNKTCNMIRDMLVEQKGINWDDFPTHQKRGSCCVKRETFIPDGEGNDYEGDGTGVYIAGYRRKEWVIDTEIPLFKNDGRNYIEKLINVGEV